MIAYHPECPHCKQIVKFIKLFAKKIEEEKIKINLIAINLSKSTWEQMDQLKIEEFPTLRLYLNDGRNFTYGDKANL
jgi:hypothetical protein